MEVQSAAGWRHIAQTFPIIDARSLGVFRLSHLTHDIYLSLAKVPRALLHPSHHKLFQYLDPRALLHHGVLWHYQETIHGPGLWLHHP